MFRNGNLTCNHSQCNPSGDSTIRVGVTRLIWYIALTCYKVWSTATMVPIYVIEPYLETNAGDIFSLVWSSALQTIYIGCQNTSLQWLDFRASVPCLPSAISVTDLSPSTSGTLTPIRSHSPRRAHKFFDSYPQYERKAADIYANNGATRLDRSTSDSERESLLPVPHAVISIPGSAVIDSAHYGYIYCMAKLEISDAQLATGSGDETVKVGYIFSGSNYPQELVSDLGLFHGRNYAAYDLRVLAWRGFGIDSKRRHPLCWLSRWLR
jgi:di- and tripeptidase